MCGFQKVLSDGGPTLTRFFNEGREDQTATKSGPLSALQRNAIKMAFRWQADDGPTLDAGLVVQDIGI